MFAPENYIPIGLALKLWRGAVDPKFIAYAADSALADSDTHASLSANFEAMNARAVVRIHYNSLEDYARSVVKEGAIRDSLNVFVQELENCEIYVSKAGSIFRAAPQILESVSEDVFEEDFWDGCLTEISEGFVDAETLKNYATLKVFAGQYFCFIDPYTWCVDTSAFDVLSTRVAEVVDPIWLAAYFDEFSALQFSDNSRDRSNVDKVLLNHFGLTQRLIDEGAVCYSGNSALTPANADVLLAFEEYEIPFLRPQTSELIQGFVGASVCIREHDWRRRLSELSGMHPKDLFDLDGRSSEERGHPTRTVNAEYRAVTEIKAFLAGNDWTGTISQLRQKTSQELGARAWRRVLDEVRKEYPSISVPGRRSSKS